jgi:hypothetical protein
MLGIHKIPKRAFGASQLFVSFTVARENPPKLDVFRQFRLTKAEHSGLYPWRFLQYGLIQQEKVKSLLSFGLSLGCVFSN